MRLLLITIVVTLIISSLSANPFVERTKTMDSTLFESLYNAMDPSNQDYYDSFMEFCWDEYTPNQSQTYDDEDDYYIYERSFPSDHPINKVQDYSKNSFIGALAFNLPDSIAIAYLNSAKDYLIYNPQGHINQKYLDLSQNFWNTLGNDGGKMANCIAYGTLLENVAIIVDNLWYYQLLESSEQDSLLNKLTTLAEFAYLLLKPDNNSFNGARSFISDNTYPYPDSLATFYNNGRIRLAGALGYAGCVLDSIDYIEAAEHDLFVRGDSGGFLGLMTNNSGYYGEGMSYTEYTFRGLTNFFVARKRLYGVDRFQHHLVKNIYEKSLNLISPVMGYVPFDDTWEILEGNNPRYFKPTFGEIVALFYQSEEYEHEIRNHIGWFVNNYHALYNRFNSPNYTSPGNVNFNKFYCYNPQRKLVEGIYDIPSSVGEGVYSDSELTIFRKPIISNDVYKNLPVMYINHGNSGNNSSHKHSDNSSFILYYKGKELLIDPGYRPSHPQYDLAKEWLASPFAHNVIIVNPHHVFYESLSNNDSTYVESTTLTEFVDTFPYLDIWNGQLWNERIKFKYKHFQPVGGSNLGYYYTVPINPSDKNFLITSDDLTHLQIELDYNHPDWIPYPDSLRNDIINVKRNFYAVDLETDQTFFFIYDEVTSSDHARMNVFMNQLHFSLYPYNNPDVNDQGYIEYHGDGRFSHKHYNENVFLHGAMGSKNYAQYILENELPQGLYYKKAFTSVPLWLHRSLRIKTNTTSNEKFLTFLYPSVSNDTPIEYVQYSSNGYGVKYGMNIYNQYNSYCAVYDGSSFFRFLEDEIRFYTSSEFFLIEADELFENINRFIIYGGSSLEIRDDSPEVRFENTIVFDSDNDQIEEVIAGYDSDCLHIIIKPYPTIPDDFYPKYKVMRSGVAHYNFQSSSFSVSNYNNVRSLAYDDKYFYVNYSYSDYINDNLLTSDFIIHQGTFDNITIQGITTFGEGDIIFYNEIMVPIGVELIFLTDSRPKLTPDTHFIIGGSIVAEGIEEKSVVFDSKNPNHMWYRIEIENTGTGIFRFCEFQNANLPLTNRGIITIENCLFQNNNAGIFIDNPASFIIMNSTIDDCNNFGILVRNSHLPMNNSIIENNLIINNKVGIWCYNASPYLFSNNILTNKLAGLRADRLSDPIVTKTSISFTYDDPMDNPEIRLSDKSYPVIDKHHNNIVFNNGYSIYHLDSSPQDFFSRELWWGTTDENSILNSFYPPNWNVEFMPFAEEPHEGYIPPYGGTTFFREGLLAESVDDFNTAQSKYFQSIEEDINTIEAKWALSRLINITTQDSGYWLLQQYYNQIQTQYPETLLSKVARLNEIFCDRLVFNYQDAINEYENLLLENLSFIDSVYTQLDIVYTYMEASSGSNRAASLTFNNPENELVSMEQAKKRELELWELLDNYCSHGGIYSPIITEVSLQKNYPNPFNPDTVIGFSIPDEGRVRLSVYNIKGQKVVTLHDSYTMPGTYSLIWNGRDDRGRQMSSGVYFYQLVTEKKIITRKMMMLK